jgi:hypothetical protein
LIDFETGEVCDDGNVINETECPYGDGECTGCSADCSAELPLTGPFCGDGLSTCPEHCDDGNNLSCGTCSANCSTLQSAHATGLIVAVVASSIVDTDGFTIDDGLGTTASFEFDSDDDVVPGHLPILLSGSESSSIVATRIRNAIETSDLQIDATTQGALVFLVHQFATSLGNQTMLESVNDEGFLVMGMASGAGGDCEDGVRCSTNDDCVPGLVCDTTLKECSPQP